jgi:hypothetical protein
VVLAAGAIFAGNLFGTVFAFPRIRNQGSRRSDRAAFVCDLVVSGTSRRRNLCWKLLWTTFRVFAHNQGSGFVFLVVWIFPPGIPGHLCFYSTGYPPPPTMLRGSESPGLPLPHSTADPSPRSAREGAAPAESSLPHLFFRASPV